MAQLLEQVRSKQLGSEEFPPHEGKLTKEIERQTSKIPSVGYLSLAIGSMVLSAGLVIFAERKSLATFVGQWAPTFLLLGIYNKLVKLEGSDYSTRSASSSSS